MQTAAKEALDISQETAETHKLYGLDEPRRTKYWGTRCLIARRLVERGVRFVQIFLRQPALGPSRQHRRSRCRCAASRPTSPTAALVQGPQAAAACSTRRSSTGAARWAGCRSMQNEKNIGRDHNTYGFSIWLAGGGIKARLRPRRDRRVRPQGGRERRQPLRLPRHAAAPLRPRSRPLHVPAAQRPGLADRWPAGTGRDRAAGMTPFHVRRLRRAPPLPAACFSNSVTSSRSITLIRPSP